MEQWAWKGWRCRKVYADGVWYLLKDGRCFGTFPMLQEAMRSAEQVEVQAA